MTCVLIFLSISATGWTEEATDPRVKFDIPQQRADLALMEFAEQADLTLFIPHELVQDIEANALVGTYTLQDGIDVSPSRYRVKPHVQQSCCAEYCSR